MIQRRYLGYIITFQKVNDGLKHFFPGETFQPPPRDPEGPEFGLRRDVQVRGQRGGTVIQDKVSASGTCIKIIMIGRSL